MNTRYKTKKTFCLSTKISPKNEESSDQNTSEPEYTGYRGPNASYVKIVSADGHNFYIKKEYALFSGTIRAMFSTAGSSIDPESENVVTLHNIYSDVVAIICDYLTYKGSYNDAILRLPPFSINPELSLQVIAASNFLDV